MADFIQNGSIASFMLAALALEIALAAVFFWRKGQGIGLFSFLANGLAGAGLVLALRAALLQSGWLFVAIYLLAGLLAHVADVALRVVLVRRAAGAPLNN